MATVLIAGCGYVGTRLGELLAAQGETIYGLRRRTGSLPRPIIPIRADLSELDSIPELPAEITKVVYCAAAAAHDEQSYRAIYVQGLQNLLRVLRESGCTIERFLYVSSSGVYGQDDGELVNEESITEPRGFAGRVLLDGEERALRNKFPTTVVRFSGIYGPGRVHLAQQILNGQAASYVGVSQVSNSIHREDCAGLLSFLLSYPAELEPVYIGSDEEPVDRASLLRFIAGCLNAPPPPLLPAHDAPASLRGANKRLDSSRVRALGYRFVYPTFREGYPPVCAPLVSR